MPVRKVDYLLIGGGLASANTARWLREEGADGEIVLVGREPDPPYNRPECSKGYLRGEEQREEAFFRPDGWWQEQKIELLTEYSEKYHGKEIADPYGGKPKDYEGALDMIEDACRGLVELAKHTSRRKTAPPAR